MASKVRLGAIDLPSALAVAGYVVIGCVLLLSRFVGLDRSYGADELWTVTRFISAGPREILAGYYIPNNHELFSLLGWATGEVFGLSAVELRLWSAVPFVLGVAGVTTWLHVRVGRLAALFFLFFATFSPMLLDITRQARGYGLAFLAMGVVTVAALEAERSGRTAAISLFCAGGIVGTMTLPHFGVAFLATGTALAWNPGLRRRTVIGLVVSTLAALAWYAPHADGIARSSQQDYAAPIQTAWLLTAPIDQTLVAALGEIDEAAVPPGLASLFVVVALALVIGSSPLLRDRRTALLLVTGLLATIFAFWATSTNATSRFFSFLLVPLLMLLATGIASILTRFVAHRRPVVRTLLVVMLLTVFTVIAVDRLQRVVRLPREATREAAELARDLRPPSTPVIAYMQIPPELEAYLGRKVEKPDADAASSVCNRPVEVILISQPWIVPPVDFPCTRRPGARHYAFRQYARGGRIDVWIIPPSS